MCKKISRVCMFSVYKCRKMVIFFFLWVLTTPGGASSEAITVSESCPTIIKNLTDPSVIPVESVPYRSPFVALHNENEFGDCRGIKSCKDVMNNLHKRQINNYNSTLVPILYNFCIGGDGVVYEGQGWESELTIDGIAVCIIGNFSENATIPVTVEHALKKFLECSVSDGRLINDFKVIARSFGNSTKSFEAVIKTVKNWPQYDDNHTLSYEMYYVQQLHVPFSPQFWQILEQKKKEMSLKSLEYLMPNTKSISEVSKVEESNKEIQQNDEHKKDEELKSEQEQFESNRKKRSVLPSNFQEPDYSGQLTDKEKTRTHKVVNEEDKKYGLPTNPGKPAPEEKPFQAAVTKLFLPKFKDSVLLADFLKRSLTRMQIKSLLTHLNYSVSNLDETHTEINNFENVGLPVETYPVIQNLLWKPPNKYLIRYKTNEIGFVTIDNENRFGECSNQEECINIMKKIREYDMKQSNLLDIPYHFCVGGDGRVYEGLGWNRHASLLKLEYPGLSLCLIGVFDKKNKSMSLPMESSVIKFLDNSANNGLLKKNFKIIIPNINLSQGDLIMKSYAEKWPQFDDKLDQKYLLYYKQQFNVIGPFTDLWNIAEIEEKMKILGHEKEKDFVKLKAMLTNLAIQINKELEYSEKFAESSGTNNGKNKKSMEKQEQQQSMREETLSISEKEKQSLFISKTDEPQKPEIPLDTNEIAEYLNAILTPLQLNSLLDILSDSAFKLNEHSSYENETFPTWCPEITPSNNWTQSNNHLVKNDEDPIDFVSISNEYKYGNCMDQKSCQDVMRKMKERHIESGFLDILHNFCIGGDGHVYEGIGWNHYSTTPKLEFPGVSLCLIGNFAKEKVLHELKNVTQSFLECSSRKGHLSKNYKVIPHFVVKKMKSQENVEKFLKKWDRFDEKLEPKYLTYFKQRFHASHQFIINWKIRLFWQNVELMKNNYHEKTQEILKLLKLLKYQMIEQFNSKGEKKSGKTSEVVHPKNFLQSEKNIQPEKLSMIAKNENARIMEKPGVPKNLKESFESALTVLRNYFNATFSPTLINLPLVHENVSSSISTSMKTEMFGQFKSLILKINVTSPINYTLVDYKEKKKNQTSIVDINVPVYH